MSVASVILTVVSTAIAYPPSSRPLDDDDRGEAVTVELWTDPEGAFDALEEVRVYFETSTRVYVTILRIDTDGRPEILFPGTPWRSNWVSEDRVHQVRPGPHQYTFLADNYPGRGYLFAIASHTPFRFDGLISREEWDYELVGVDGRIATDPYVALMDLIDIILPEPGGEYEYDVLPYDVGETHEYPRFLCYDCHASTAYPIWNPYGQPCTRVQIVIYDDPLYYPARFSGGTRVVFPRPRRLGPQYILRPRSPDSPYVVRERRRARSR